KPHPDGHSGRRSEHPKCRAVCPRHHETNVGVGGVGCLNELGGSLISCLLSASRVEHSSFRNTLSKWVAMVLVLTADFRTASLLVAFLEMFPNQSVPLAIDGHYDPEIHSPGCSRRGSIDCFATPLPLATS